MEHVFGLEIGDWASDGHCVTKTRIVKCTHSCNDVIEAHKKIKSKGLDLTEECEEYGQTRLSSEFVDKLKELFTDPIKKFNLEERNGYVWLNYDSFATFYMNLAATEIDALEYKFITLPSISIGGYGFFE